jgi:hypothetical protein
VAPAVRSICLAFKCITKSALLTVPWILLKLGILRAGAWRIPTFWMD